MIDNPSPWGETRYNVLVQQVEGVSDLLQTVVNQVKPIAKSDAVARELVKLIEGAITSLDVTALEMLSHYDVMAKAMHRTGFRRDPRRPVVKQEPSETDRLRLLKHKAAAKRLTKPVASETEHA